MLRLIAFLVTGFWPSRNSLRAIRKDLDDLQRALTTLKKRHDTLAGSYYAEFEPVNEPRTLPAGSSTSAPPDAIPFPEDEFQQRLAERRSQRGNLG